MNEKEIAARDEAANKWAGTINPMFAFKAGADWLAAYRDKIIHGTNKSEIYTERIKQSGPEFPDAEFDGYCRDNDLGASKEQTRIARWAWAKCCEMHVNLIKSADEYLESLEAENKRLREELSR